MGTTEADAATSGVSNTTSEEPGGTTSVGNMGSSVGSSGSESTGEPDPYEAPESCSLQDDCTHDCDADRPIEYWYGCDDAPICTIEVEPDAEDVRCAIEALRDQTPGWLLLKLEEVAKDSVESFSSETVYFRTSTSGLVARGLELEQYDPEVGQDYQTTLAPLARTHAPDDPVWEACLSPEPDIGCLLDSSQLFAETCIDEAFEPCGS